MEAWLVLPHVTYVSSMIHAHPWPDDRKMMEEYDAIFKGDYSRLPQKQSSVVRIFLSSTFGGSTNRDLLDH